MRRIHGVEDILLGFEPKDAGSIPAGSVYFFIGDNSEVHHSGNSRTVNPPWYALLRCHEIVAGKF